MPRSPAHVRARTYARGRAMEIAMEIIVVDSSSIGAIPIARAAQLKRLSDYRKMVTRGVREPPSSQGDFIQIISFARSTDRRTEISLLSRVAISVKFGRLVFATASELIKRAPFRFSSSFLLGRQRTAANSKAPFPSPSFLPQKRNRVTVVLS